MSGRLDRSGLMDIDMPGIRRDHTLMRPQNRRDHGRIRLRAAHKELHLCIFLRTECADLHPRSLTINILPITRRLLQIRLHQAA